MSLVFLESPFHSKDPIVFQRNIAYAQRCMLDSRRRNELPFVSHLLWTQHPESPTYFIDDEKYRYEDIGREKALKDLRIIRKRCDKVIFCIDYGYSSGMLEGLKQCQKENIPYEVRCIGDLEKDEITAKMRLKISE